MEWAVWQYLKRGTHVLWGTCILWNTMSGLFVYMGSGEQIQISLFVQCPLLQPGLPFLSTSSVLILWWIVLSGVHHTTLPQSSFPRSLETLILLDLLVVSCGLSLALSHSPVFWINFPHMDLINYILVFPETNVLPELFISTVLASLDTYSTRGSWWCLT